MEKNDFVVMVVEDEEMLLSAIVNKLKLAGKQVIACVSGEKALEALSTQDRLPDVIWLDYYLKGMNGMEFMGKLKADPKLANIPVMVVTNSASAEKASKLMAMGVRRYLLKAESKLKDLIQVVNEVGGSKPNGN